MKVSNRIFNNPDAGTYNHRKAVTVLDDSATALPSSALADGVSLQEDDRALFTNLSDPADNNKVYKVRHNALVLAEDGIATNGMSLPGDMVYVKQGSHGGELWGFEANAWENLDVDITDDGGAPSGGGSSSVGAANTVQLSDGAGGFTAATGITASGGAMVVGGGSSQNSFSSFSSAGVNEFFFGAAAAPNQSFVISKYLGDYADLHMWGATTNHIVLTNNGRVGIGTNTPSTELDIVGNTRMSGSLNAAAALIGGAAPVGSSPLTVRFNPGSTAGVYMFAGSNPGDPGFGIESDGSSVTFQGTNAGLAGAVPLRLQGSGDLYLGPNLKWPSADGTSGQSLTTNGSGILSWEDPTAPASALANDTFLVGRNFLDNANVDILKVDINNKIQFSQNRTYFGLADTNIVTFADPDYIFNTQQANHTMAMFSGPGDDGALAFITVADGSFYLQGVASNDGTGSQARPLYLNPQGSNIFLGSGAGTVHLNSFSDGNLSVSGGSIISSPVARLRFTKNDAQIIPNVLSTFQTVLLDDTDYDNTSGAFVAGVFTVPAGHDGYYQMCLNITAASTGTGAWFTTIRKNGSEVCRGGRNNVTGSVTTGSSLATILLLTAGDVVDFGVFNETGSDITVEAFDPSNTVSISRLS